MSSIARSRPTRSSGLRCVGGLSWAGVLGPIGTSVLLVAIVAFLVGQPRRDLLSALRHLVGIAAQDAYRTVEGSGYVGWSAWTRAPTPSAAAGCDACAGVCAGPGCGRRSGS